MCHKVVIDGYPILVWQLSPLLWKFKTTLCLPSFCGWERIGDTNSERDRSDRAGVFEHISKIIQYSCASVSLPAAGVSLCQPVAAKLKLSGCLVSKDTDSAGFARHKHTLTQTHKSIKVLFLVRKAALGSFNSRRWAVRDFKPSKYMSWGKTVHVHIKTVEVPRDKYLHAVFTLNKTVKRSFLQENRIHLLCHAVNTMWPRSLSLRHHHNTHVKGMILWYLKKVAISVPVCPDSSKIFS